MVVGTRKLRIRSKAIGLALLVLSTLVASFELVHNPVSAQYGSGGSSVTISTPSNALAGGGSNTMMMTMQTHILKGLVSNVQLDDKGQPAWIQSGWWILRINTQTNNQAGAWFLAKIVMVKPDGTAYHIHAISNFSLSNFSTEGNSTIVFKGSATVLMPNGPASEVPVTIKVMNMNVFAIWIGPDKVNGHFGSSPLYGTVFHSNEGRQSGIGQAMIGASMAKMQSLTKTNIPITIPLSMGLYDGKNVLFTTTEVSDSQQASLLTSYTKFHVTYAPALANTPPQALGTIFVFKNGVNGTGPMGFQPDVFDSIPGDPGYTPLWKVSIVEWKNNFTGANATQPTILASDNDIADTQSKGQVTVTQTNIVVNCPIIQWGGNEDGTIPAGHMKIRENATLTDTTPYGGGQLLNIDTNKSQATFVGHRGFGPDGSTIYYIVTDASMQGPANMMGLIFTNRTASIISSSASSDLFQFANGIKGTGPMGFQAGIGSTLPGSNSYSPIWRIQMISWKDPASATMLTSTKDIADHSNQITIMPSGMVVNCPFVNPGG